jgi:hypothetical protein
MAIARLHVFKGPQAAVAFRRGRRVEWHAGKETRAGEVAFFYEASPVSAIVGIGRATGMSWNDPKWGLLIAYERILVDPLPLKALPDDPVAGRWPVWRMLSRTHVQVPPVTASALARLVIARSPRAGPFLAALATGFD